MSKIQKDHLDRPVSVLRTKRFFILPRAVRPTAIAGTRNALWVLDSDQKRLYLINVGPGSSE